jgi:hypothetical protein
MIVKREDCKETEDRHAPPDASDAADALPNVYNRASTQSSTSSPSGATIPRPPGLYKLVACTSSTTKYGLPARREDLVHDIEHRAKQKRRESTIHVAHSTATKPLLLPSTRPGEPERNVQRATNTLHYVRRDSACAVRRGWHGHHRAPTRGWPRRGAGRRPTAAQKRKGPP